MSKLPNEQELKALVEMAKNFETQIREQSETVREIAIKCEEIINQKQKNQKAKKI
jgi:hypothetical protein